MTQDVDFRLTARNETKAAFDEARRGLGALGDSAAAARATLATLGAAAGVTAFVAMVHQTADATAKYKDLAEVAGTTASRISGMEVPARLAGKSLDDVANIVAKLGKFIGEARLGDSGKGTILSALGIDADDGRDAAEVMVDVAQALTSMTDKTVQGKVANDLLGKSYAEARPFLAELAAQGELVARVTDAQAEAADRYKDNLEKVMLQVDQARLKFVGDLLPALVDVSEEMVTIARETNALSVAGQAGIVFFQTIAVLAANVSFVFQGVGREIGGIAAQLTALVTSSPGEAFKNFTAIGDAIREDAVRARAELDSLEKRIMMIGQTKPDVKDNFDFFGSGGNPMIKGLRSTAEDAIRARMKFEEEYKKLVAQAQGFADVYSAAIKTGNVLVQEARKAGMISEEEMIRGLQANEDARLQVMIQSLQKQEQLHKQKGDLLAAEQARQKIAAAEAERTASQIIADAKISSSKEIGDEKFKQELAQKMARIQEENFTEREALQHHLIEKRNIIDMAEAQGLISAENAKKQRETLELNHQAKLGSATAQGLLQRRALEQMNMQQQAQFYFGHLAQITAAGAQHNRGLFELNKVASIANAIISTEEGVAKALKWGWPMGPIFAGIIGAAGAASIAAIASTSFQGGGSASAPVYAASPATGLSIDTGSAPAGFEPPAKLTGVAKEAPRAQINITLIGETQSSESVRQLIKRIAEEQTYGADITIR